MAFDHAAAQRSELRSVLRRLLFWSVLPFLLASGCGISQTTLTEAVEAVQREVADYSNRLDRAQFAAIDLTNRVQHLTAQVQEREADLALLRQELTHQEEQVQRARQYIHAQTVRFTRAIDAARGLQPEGAEPEIPEGLPKPQALSFAVEGTATNVVELFDLAAFPSEFFPDKHGNIQITPALRLSIRNLTKDPVRLNLYARRVGTRDPFGMQGVDLPPEGTVARIRIPYDPSHDLFVRIGKLSTRYLLKSQ